MGARAKLLTLAIAACASIAKADAHGFGQRYDLPIPLWLYLTAAALIVALSFALATLFVRASPADLAPRDFAKIRTGQTLAAFIRFVCQLLGVAVYLLVMIAGFIGAQSPLKNIAPVMVWAIWWVGMAYFCALIGNLWALVNPLDALFGWAEMLYARLRSGRPLSLHLAYPEWLGVWPAVGLFLVFTWMELAWQESDAPASLATAILAYSLLTWVGMFLFGRAEWLDRGEVFSIVFALLSRFAPIEVRVIDGKPQLSLRPYAVGLIANKPAHPSLIVLVVAMLATVSFDGFIETPAWAAIIERFTPQAPENNLADAAPESTRDAIALTLGLILTPLLFLVVYFFVCRLIASHAATEAHGRTMRIAGFFVLTLVPIAIAYHVAHYLSFLAMAGQYLIPLASDPFGYRWDLFGGANYFIKIGLIDARALWYISVAAIVAGHVAAVYLAHVQALREFPDRQGALRSQYPMLVLMVGYTMTSLWIIAQPIVTSRFG